MASQHQVRKYLAYWFQLGKKVLIQNGEQYLLPRPVIEGNRYSREFEECWQIVTSATSGDCYLDGTHQTIAELLTAEWEVEDCARCAMPIPQKNRGLPDLCCPCFDLPLWPDTHLPVPRSPIDSKSYLNNIHHRLVKLNETQDTDETQDQHDNSECLTKTS